MKCFYCNRSAATDGVSLFRVNEKGVKGIWACREHLMAKPDPEVDAVVRAIEDGKAK